PFLAAVKKSTWMRALFTSRADAFTAQVLQTAACNARHSTKERLARWLLAALDRCATDRINLTHDDLAVAFGVRRPTVTLIVRSLSEAASTDTRREPGHADATFFADRSCRKNVAGRSWYGE